MKKTLEILKTNWQWITLLVAILGVGIKIGTWFHEQNKEMDELKKSSWQALIYSDAPLVQRAESCDNYLENGFDSYTKDYCNRLLEKVENYNN